MTDTTGNISAEKTIGGLIERIRGSTTQIEFAAHLGVPLTTLQRYESGESNPDEEFLIMLCEKCQVDPIWLLIGKETNSGGVEGSLEFKQLADRWWRDPLEDLDRAVLAVTTFADLLNNQRSRNTVEMSMVGNLLDVLCDGLVDGLENWNSERHGAHRSVKAPQ